MNPSDVGTRPDKVTMSDVGPGSPWESGEVWMTMEMEAAQKLGFIKPAKSLRIRDDQEDDFKKGLTFEKVPELLTRGHHVNEKRLGLLEERAEFSQYLVLPTKYPFPKVVRIMSIVVGFVSKLRKGRKILGHLLSGGRLRFTVFLADVEIDVLKDDCDVLLAQGAITVGDEEAGDDQETQLVTYFGENISSQDQKDMYYSVQAVRTEQGDTVQMCYVTSM